MLQNAEYDTLNINMLQIGVAQISVYLVYPLTYCV